MDCIAQNQLINRDMDRFIEHCDMAMAPIPDMGYYSCVALCAFDAVFSIQSRYNSVVSPLIDRLCGMMNIRRHFDNPYILPSVEQQIKISDFINKMNCSDPEILAKRLNNHQRTSSKSGILKTDAFFQYLGVFRELGIETYQDVFIDTTRRDNLELKLRRIIGQNVAVDYFFMLAGNTDDVKVDTWIRRFVRDAVGKNDLTPEQIKQ